MICDGKNGACLCKPDKFDDKCQGKKEKKAEFRAQKAFKEMEWFFWITRRLKMILEDLSASLDFPYKMLR